MFSFCCCFVVVFFLKAFYLHIILTNVQFEKRQPQCVSGIRQVTQSDAFVVDSISNGLIETIKDNIKGRQTFLSLIFSVIERV